MNRAVGGLLIAALAAVLIAGCGSTMDRAERVTLASLNLPAATPAPASVTPPGRTCGTVTASLRPPAVMPAPGHMPAGSFMAQIVRRGYLIAGVGQNTLLFGYFNPVDRRLEGFEIDLLKRLADAIFGRKPGDIRFKVITTDQRIAAVQSGSVDVVADAMTITCARRRQVDFSTVYYDAGQKLLVPSGSSVRGVQDLAGKPVCVTVGTTTLYTLEHARPRPQPYEVAERSDCLVALQAGLADAVTSDDSILLGFEAQDPYTKIVGARLADEPYGMAIRRSHPDFVRFVNGVLARMRADGSWRSI